MDRIRWARDLPRSGAGQPGLKVLDWIDHDARREWWEGYAGRLTPEERKRIAAGEYHPIRRSYRPTIIEGRWLNVTHRAAGQPCAKLRVLVGKVELKRGWWLIHIARVRDDRPPRTESANSHRRTYEAVDDTTTLSGAQGRAPEEELVQLEDWSRRSRLRRAEFTRDAIREAA